MEAFVLFPEAGGKFSIKITHFMHISAKIVILEYKAFEKQFKHTK